LPCCLHQPPGQRTGAIEQIERLEAPGLVDEAEPDEQHEPLALA